MLRSIEQPRLVGAVAVLGVLAAAAFIGCGVLIGRGSVEDAGPTKVQLRRVTASRAALKSELRTVTDRLEARVGELEASERHWRERAVRTEAALERWKKRARRAERARR